MDSAVYQAWHAEMLGEAGPTREAALAATAAACGDGFDPRGWRVSMLCPCRSCRDGAGASSWGIGADGCLHLGRCDVG